MDILVDGMFGFGIIGSLMQYILYVVGIIFLFRATKALNIYINKNG